MAEYRGYRCDQCDHIVDKADLTRRTVRYVGTHAEGEYDEDLCHDCTSTLLKDAPDLRPLRRRATAPRRVVSA